MCQNTIIFRIFHLETIIEQDFKDYEIFTIIFDFVAQQIFFYSKRPKKKRFSINRGKSVIFQKVRHHRSSKNGQNLKIFSSEVFSSFKGDKNKKWTLYITETFCSTPRKTKKKNVSPYFVPWLLCLPISK